MDNSRNMEAEKSDARDSEEHLEELKGLEEFGELEELEPLDELAPAEEAASSETQTAASPRKKSRRLPPLLRLTRRTTVFLSLTLIATILFFITGNRQTFLDSNLNLILKIIAANAIALSFFSATAILECVFYLLKDKRLKLTIHLVCYALILAVALAVSVLSLTINLLSEGIDF